MGHSMGGAGTHDPRREVQLHVGRARPNFRRRRHRRRRRGPLQITADAHHARREGLDCSSRDLAPRRGRVQAVGAPHLYLEFPDKDHEFWIRRGAAQMEKVFAFFSLISKRTTVLPPK